MESIVIGQRYVAKADTTVYLSRAMDGEVHEPTEYKLAEGTVVEVAQTRASGAWMQLLTRVMEMPTFFLVEEKNMSNFERMPS